MGVHSGLSDPACFARDQGSERWHYGGGLLNTSKHVGDAAHGGQLMRSGSTFGQLQLSGFEHLAALMPHGQAPTCD